MTDFIFPRRRVLASGLSAAALVAATPALAALKPTPRQTRGPFYPESFPLDSDNDLVRVKGKSARALGEVTHLSGRILDTDGKPVPGARVEIWQCDANGVYHHQGDGRRSRIDGNFQGYGRARAAADGGYRFRTIKPVPYPGRTPHIHFAVAAPGFEAVSTQMYIEGHPQNARDFVYRGVAGSAAVIAARFSPASEIERGALKARFDLVLNRA
ncbi:MAG TPA: protocatechuate 3,4-dioxygenase [Alphaproteobacteria bacterium]|nr:protocatechuate 3,4-dioxygenase [Alphaproteobacteria bacterium]